MIFFILGAIPVPFIPLPSLLSPFPPSFLPAPPKVSRRHHDSLRPMTVTVFIDGPKTSGEALVGRDKG